MMFKFRKGTFIYVCIMALIFASLTIAEIKQGGLDASGVLFVIALIFLIILAFVAYVISMDIVIDKGGVYRKFFGRKVLFLNWSEVKVIKDVVKKNLSGKSVRSFYMIPVAEVSLSFWSGGWIRFSDSMYDFSSFVHAINEQVRSHNIGIERVRGADIDVCDEVFESDRDDFKLP